MSHVPAIVVLGAGAGSRYRGPRHKLSEPVGGVPVLALTLRNAIATGLPVVVVATAALLEAVPALSHLVPAQDLVLVDEVGAAGPGRPGTGGMGESIAAGVAGSAGASGWLVLPGDMPMIRPASLVAVAQALDQLPIAYAQFKGRRGHPVGFGSELFSELVHLRGDEGARRLLARYPSAAVELDDPGVLFDVDTVEDVAALRHRLDEGVSAAGSPRAL
jgi:molybdenum cofactor cytidylyltransferase